MKPAGNVDLNCDLGEGEPWERTAALLRRVTSANAACGGHAGDGATMRAVAREARRLGVRLGAHPGHPGNFGRTEVPVDAAGLEALLAAQLSAVSAAAAAEGVGVAHVKLHGALYHQVDRDPVLAGAALRQVVRSLPGAVVYAPPTGWLARLGPEAGVEVWPEGFLDRGYRDDGTLVPRGEPGAMLCGPAAVEERVAGWLRDGTVATASGGRVAVPARTWCVHGDTPDAVAMAGAAARALGLGTAAGA